MANGGRINWTMGFITDKTGLNDFKTALEQISVQAKLPGNALNEGLQKAASTANQLYGILEKCYNENLGTLNVNKFSQELVKSNISATEIKNTMSSIGAQGANAFNAIGSSILNTNVLIKESNTLLDKMAVTMANTVRFGIASSIFNNITNSISKAVNYAEDLNESLTNIRIVSGQSANQMADFAEQANNAAKSMGSTTLDYTDSALIYYQQGLSAEEVEERTDVTIKMANALGETASEVSNYMTAIWNNFDNGSESLEHYGDVLTALGASTASSSAEIAEGLSKFASIADTVGLSYDYASSALATIVANTRQSADTVGTSLKTIFSRLQGLQLGDTADDGTDLNKYSKALAAVGIDIKDQNDELKDMDTILDELASKWGTLRKDTKMALAETVAGTRQYTQLVSLMDNWDDMEENLKTAADATGTLNEQQSIYLEGTQAKLNKLKATWQDLYSGLVDEDELNAGIDALRNLIQAFDNFIDSFGGGMKSIAALGASVAGIFSKQISGALNQAIKNQQIYNQNLATINYKADLIKTGASEVKSNSAEGQGLLSQYKTELEYAKRIKDIRAGISGEEYNELTTLQQKIGQIQGEITYSEKVTEQEALKVGISQQDIDLMFKEESQQEEIAGKYYEQAEAAKQKQKILDNINETIQKEYMYVTDVKQTDKEVLNISHQIQAIQKEYKDTQDPILKKIRNRLDIYYDVNDEENSIVKNEEHIKNLINEINKYEKKRTEEKQKQSEAAKDILKTSKNNKQKNTDLTNIKEDFDDKEFNTKQSLKVSQITTTITSGLSLLTTTWGAVSSVIDTATDSTISFGDKVSQIISTLSFSLPAIIKDFENMSEILNGSKLFDPLIKQAKEWLATNALVSESTAASIIVSQEEEKHNLKVSTSTAEKIIMKKIEAGVTDKATASEILENIEKELNIKLTDQQTKLLTKLISVKEKLTKVINGTTIKFVALIAACVALSVAIVKVIQKIRDMNDAQDKTRADALLNSSVSTAEKLEEEATAIEDVSNSLSELKEQYDSGSITEAEFRDNAYKLAKQLGDEELAVIALTGSYEELQKAMENRSSQANKQLIESEEIVEQNALAAGAADIKVNRGETEVDEEDGKWTIDLKGSNGLNSANENDFMQQLKSMGVDIGNGSGHIDAESFLKAAAENEDKMEALFQAAAGTTAEDAATQLKEILEQESDYIDKYKEAAEAIKDTKLSELENETKSNFKEDDINTTDEYQNAIQDYALKAFDTGDFDTYEEAEKYAEEFYAGLNDKTTELSQRSTLSDTIMGMFTDNNATDLTTEEIGEALEGLSTSQLSGVASLEEDDLTARLNNLKEAGYSTAEALAVLGDRYAVLEEDTFSLTDEQEALIDGFGLSKSKTEDYIEEVEDYAKQLHDTAKSVDAIDDRLADNADVAVEVAAANKRMNKGLEDLGDNYEDWLNVIKDANKKGNEAAKSTADYAEAMEGLRTSLEDILGLDTDALSENFINNNLDLIKQAAEGDVDAIQKLRVEASNDILMNVIGVTDFSSLDQNLQDEIAYINQLAMNNDFKIGAKLDDTDFLYACEDIINQAHMTAEQATQYLASMGIDAEVKEVPAEEVATHTWYSPVIEEKGGYYQVVDTKEITAKDTVTGTAGFALEVSNATYNGKSGGTVNYSNTKAGKAAANKSSGGGSSSDNTPDHEDTQDDEIDYYEKVNVELKQIATNLNRVSNQEKKLTGSSLVNNLNEQISILNQQIDKTREKLQIAANEQATLQQKLAAYGISFNSDGTIANYAQAYENQLAAYNNIINTYNSMDKDSQETYKDTVDAAKDSYEKFNDLVSDYDTLIADTIPGLQDDIQEYMDEIVEDQIKAFKVGIEIDINWKELQEEWLDFKKNVIDDIDDDDILGNLLSNMDLLALDYDSNGNGLVKELGDTVSTLVDQANQYLNTGWASIYGDDAATLQEDLEEYTEKLMDEMESVKDLIDEIKAAYNDMLDQIQDTYDDGQEYYEFINDTINHGIELTELLYGEDAYSELESYYQRLEDNYNQQVAAQKEEVNFWKTQMDTLEEGSEAWETAKDNWMDATKDWQSLVEEAIENLQDKYTNAIDAIFQEYEKQITNGKTLDDLSTEWDRINNLSDQYLDNVNAAYGISKLESKYLDSIEATDSINAQEKLRDIYEEQIGYLREKENITQYDLDRAELEYELALKQIALQEAQQNKSTMRLKRDSQGNYSYEYVADEDQVSSITQEIEDLKNQIYNLDLDTYKDNLSQIKDAYTETVEECKEIAEDATLSEEERAEKLQDAWDYYYQFVENLADQNATIRANLSESADDEIAAYNLEVTTEQLIPQWDSGVQEMIDKFSADDGESFKATTLDTYDQIMNANEEYEKDLDELQEVAETDFEDIQQEIDDTTSATQELIEYNNNLTSSYQNQLSTIGSLISQVGSLENQYKSLENELATVANAAVAMWSALNGTGNPGYSRVTVTGTGTAVAGSSTAAKINNAINTLADSADEKLEEDKQKQEQQDQQNQTTTSYRKVWLSLYEYAFVDSNDMVLAVGSAEPGNSYKTPMSGSLTLEKLIKSRVSGYDTGGYTGDWGSTSGKLAMLHEKELVLNKVDTENILNAVNIMRDMTANMSRSMLDRLAMTDVSANDFSNLTGSGTQQLEQNVHIEANFPNVTNHTEIEDAINNLTNVASQYINRNKK